MIHIENDGPEIRTTNYWQTEQARCGFAYASWNAAALRLLLPTRFAGSAGVEAVIADMQTAEYVIVTRGTWRPGPMQTPRQDALELLFEDGTEAPFSLHVVREQYDRIPARDDEGRVDLACLVYTEGPRLRLRLPARYRRASKLPCLKPWNGN